jgi:hypothetical protein
VARAGGDSKYFARYAEPAARLAAAISAVYSAAIVVPLCRESIAFLRGYEAAIADSAERVLLILVVNGAEGASAETHAVNQRLLGELARRFPERTQLRAEEVRIAAELARSEHCDLIWLDCASPGARLPSGEGVGLARKIGADLAAALWARGRIVCSQIGSSDADATLPNDYFARVAASASTAASSALLWPFAHEASGERAIDEATELYEISLRYYVLGLAAAKSPYAYQSIGSSLSFDAAAYASVRGFPKRAAAEDFYLLDKLAKVGPLRRVSGAPIRLAARASDRVPFGTGRGTSEIAGIRGRGAEFELYAPELFGALAAVIEGLNAFAESAQLDALRAAIAMREPVFANALERALERLGVFVAVKKAATEARPGAVLKRRVHTWFDALRTLRLLHLLRAAARPSLPWREALARAPFLEQPFAAGPSAGAVLLRLAAAEAALPEWVGPTLP